MSKNILSADNQQERLKTIGWIVGFVDGEGSFSVSIFQSPKTKLGWQVFPEFVVTQEEKSLSSLKILQEFFGCGNIFISRADRNDDNDNHNEPLHRYCVRSILDLQQKIIPFFKENSLKTAKKKEFRKFAEIMNLIEKKEHLTIKGMKKIAKMIEKMNRKKPSMFLESSETIRRDSK